MDNYNGMLFLVIMSVLGMGSMLWIRIGKLECSLCGNDNKRALKARGVLEQWNGDNLFDISVMLAKTGYTPIKVESDAVGQCECWLKSNENTLVAAMGDYVYKSTDGKVFVLSKSAVGW